MVIYSFAPEILGIAGIETLEIIKGVVDRVNRINDLSYLTLYNLIKKNTEFSNKIFYSSFP